MDLFCTFASHKEGSDRQGDSIHPHSELTEFRHLWGFLHPPPALPLREGAHKERSSLFGVSVSFYRITI